MANQKIQTIWGLVLILTSGFATLAHAQAQSPGLSPSECNDAQLRGSLQTLVDWDQRLLMKQARHLEAIRQLRDAETGKHPFPQLLSEIQPFDDSIKTRVQKGVTAPAAVLASDLHAKAAQNTISEKIRRHRDFRRSVDRENPSAALIEYAKSYHRERLETEGFIQYFRLRCEQANRDSNSDRQIASR